MDILLFLYNVKRLQMRPKTPFTNVAQISHTYIYIYIENRTVVFMSFPILLSPTSQFLLLLRFLTQQYSMVIC